MGPIKRAVMAAVVAAAPLAAQAEPMLKGGERELEGSASLTNATTESGGTEVDTSLLALTFRGGWFLSAENEVGLIGTLVRSDFGFGSSTIGQLGGFYDRNFPAPDSRVVPVVGVSAQAAFGDASGMVLEGSAGIRVFASDDVSVNWRLFYSVADVENSGVDLETTSVGVRAGLSWIIR